MSNSDPSTPQPIVLEGSEIPVADQTHLVLALVAVIKRLEREERKLRGEVDRLKGTTRRPKITPSRLLVKPAGKQDPKGKRPGSAKRRKTKSLSVDDTIVLQPESLPPDARLEGYPDFVVQDLIVKPHTTLYRRAVYRLPDGSVVVASRPAEIDSHFGAGLRRQVHRVFSADVQNLRIPQGGRGRVMAGSCGPGPRTVGGAGSGQWLRRASGAGQPTP